MSTDDLMAWLGPAADEMTAEQIERVRTEAAAIEQRYPEPDEQPERDAALSAVVQYLLGETTPEDAGRALVAARRAEREAYAAALQMAVMLVGDNPPQGRRGYVKVAAGRVGVDRGLLGRVVAGR